MNLGLQDKVALVTGASQGIGSAIARGLASEGCRVAATARNKTALKSLVNEITNKRAGALALPADLRRPEVPATLVRDTIAAFGRLDIIVADAGSAEAGDLFALPDEAWLDAFELKFFGHMRLIRAAWSHLVETKGVVVIIAGFAGRTPLPESAINSSVNGALLSFTKALALRGLDVGVRVNAINPGQIKTQRFQRRVDHLVETLGLSEGEAEAKMAKDYGMIRTGEPEDVADLVSFVVSERAGLLHGALIDLDGGMTKSV